MTAQIQVDHLVDACGDDPQKLAGLALLLASAAIALSAADDIIEPRGLLEQLEVFKVAMQTIMDRTTAAIARRQHG